MKRNVEQSGVCKICRCTESNCRQCIERTGKPCRWVNAEKTLCSACVLPGKITIGEKYSPAMVITDQAQADIYFEILVDHNRRFAPDRDRADAEKIERENLGYYAMYFGLETRARVERLFKCEHPLFGSIEKNGPPTAKRAFDAWDNLWRRARRLTPLAKSAKQNAKRKR